jgi:hypothetical protein
MFLLKPLFLFVARVRRQIPVLSRARAALDRKEAEYQRLLKNFRGEARENGRA